MPQIATEGKALLLVSALAERARGLCSESPFLCVARCTSAGFARTLVSGDAMHTIHNSSHPMQGTHVAGTRALPAIGTAQVRARKIWDYWKLG